VVAVVERPRQYLQTPSAEAIMNYQLATLLRLR
jgi:hypothetical protein